MTQNEFTRIIESLGSLSPEQMRQLRRELDGKLASAAKPAAAPPQEAEAEDTPDPLLGLMRDDAKLMDEIVADAYRHRQLEAWAARLATWVATHPARPITIDDSRESIYAGRGE